MGFRFYKRVNYGDGLGLNISRSGISPSIRTSLGSFGSKAFSIRTGISGLSYRGGTGKNAALIWLLTVAVTGVFIIAYNLIRLILFILSFAIASIFKEEGIDYKNLFITLSIILGILVITYYLMPL
jgi:hypothetical protein